MNLNRQHEKVPVVESQHFFKHEKEERKSFLILYNNSIQNDEYIEWYRLFGLNVLFWGLEFINIKKLLLSSFSGLKKYCDSAGIFLLIHLCSRHFS